MMNINKYFLLIPLGFLLISCQLSVAGVSPSNTTVTSTICKLNLQVYVSQGPNANHTIAGQVDLGSDAWSTFAGNIVEENGTVHPISFYFDGQAVHFTLTLEQGQVFGVGVMESGRSDCSGKGGGTLSGPALDDLGGWRGEWMPETTTSIVPVQSQDDQSGLTTSISSLLYYICITSIFILILSLLLARASRSKIVAAVKKSQAKKIKASTSGLQKIRPVVRPEADVKKLPLAEYMATYKAGDSLFDLSFEIEDNSTYLGECGILVAKTLDATSSATALELWLFGTRSIQTVSHILMSEYCYQNQVLRQELEKKGQSLPVQPGMFVTLDTKDLIVKAEILQVQYETNTPEPNSVFKKLVVRIGVWKSS